MTGRLESAASLRYGILRAKMEADGSVNMSRGNLTDPEGPWNVSARLKGYMNKNEKKLAGRP